MSNPSTAPPPQPADEPARASFPAVSTAAFQPSPTLLASPHRRDPPSALTLVSPAHPSPARHERAASVSRPRPRSFSLRALVNDPPVSDHLGNSPSLDLGQVSDWKKVTVGSIVKPEEARFVHLDTTVEDATNILTTFGSPNVVLISDEPESRVVSGTFDYSDLNTYLLGQVEKVKAGKAANPKTVEPDRIRDIQDLSRREPVVLLSKDTPLPRAVELLASGVHRIIVTEDQSKTSKVVGVLTQLRLVWFFYDNRKNFLDLAECYTRTIIDLNIGSADVVSIKGNLPLHDALRLIHGQGITSIPVLDGDDNVIGNLSQVDTRLLTRDSALPLFDSPCTTFITHIVSERGIEDGKDSFPVFYINPYSTLAYTVAKLLATKSHRLWVVNSPSPSPSITSTPVTGSALPHTPVSQRQQHPHTSPSLTAISPVATSPSARRLSMSGSHCMLPASIGSMNSPLASPHGIGAGVGSGLGLSGRLDGVVSLTDVLNMIARVSGLEASKPDGARQLWHRRRSSSSSAGSRSSFIATGLAGGAGSVGSVSSLVAGRRDRSVSSQSRVSSVGYGPSGRR